MKRLAWLLLTLSLPAWAAINGVDSSRVVLPSFDGTRYGAYVAGDFPATPSGQIYVNRFDNQPNTVNGAYYDIGTIPDQSDITHDPASISWTGIKCGSAARVYDGNLANGTALPDLSIVDDPDSAGNKVLRYYMDGTANGYNTECADTLRHRILLSWASHMNNDPLGGSGFRVLPDTEYWIGYRFRAKCAGTIYTPENKLSQVLMQTPMSSSVGEPAIYLKTNCKAFNISPERYSANAGYNGGGLKETQSTTTDEFTTDAWHCVVTRWIKKPFSVGTPTSYIADTVGGGRAGIFEVYVDGVLQKGSATYQYPAYTGTDRAGRTEWNSVFRTGIYWTTQVGDAGSSMTLYQDDFVIASGSGNAAIANPPGCPTVQVCDSGHTGNCVATWNPQGKGTP